MKCKKVLAGALSLLLSCAAIAAGKDNAFPSLEPIYVFPFNVALELSAEEILQMGLEFSLCHTDSKEYDECMEAFRVLEEVVVSEEYSVMSADVKAEAILELLYQDTLKQYLEDQTRLDVMFREGTYNCVTASVLYMALARAGGLAVCGNRTPNHAFCTVFTEDNSFDVECTNPSGFNPGSKKRIEGGSRYYTVSTSKYNGRQRVGDRMFVSLVGKNIVSLYNDQSNYDIAVPLAVTRMVFLQGCEMSEYEDARTDFDKICGNLGARYQQTYAFIDALLWLDTVRQRWGMSPLLQENYDTAVYNAVLFMCEGMDLDTAVSIYTERLPYITKSTLNDIEYLVYNTSLEQALTGLNTKEAIDYLSARVYDKLARRVEIKSRLDNLLEYYWSTYINEIVSKGMANPDGSDWEVYLTASKEASKAVKALPESTEMKLLRDQCLYNYSVCIHNRFAYLYNEGKYKEAEETLKKGIENYSDSEILKEDLKALQSSF